MKRIIFIFAKAGYLLHQIYLYLNINTTKLQELFRYLVTNFHMDWACGRTGGICVRVAEIVVRGCECLVI